MKKVIKKRWFWIAVTVMLVIGVIGNAGNDVDNNDVANNIAQTESDNEMQVEETVETEVEAEIKNVSFTIINGEIGDYGENRTLNKDTEFELTRVAYFIPAGNYNVALIEGVSVQFSVVNDIVSVVDGWEEFSEQFQTTVLIKDTKPSATIIVEDGQFIWMTDDTVELCFEMIETAE